MNTPSLVNSPLTFSMTSCRLSMCANTLFAVTSDAFPFLLVIWCTVFLLKKSLMVSMPSLFACAARLSAGSTPSAVTPLLVNPFTNSPSLLPMSTASEFFPSWNRSVSVFARCVKCSLNVFVVEVT